MKLKLEAPNPERRESGGLAASLRRPRAVTRAPPAMSEAAVEAAIAACTTLTEGECRAFLDNGFVVVKGAFSKGLAAEVVHEE